MANKASRKSPVSKDTASSDALGNLPDISHDIKIKYELFKEVLGTGKHEPVAPLKVNEMLMINVDTNITVGTVDKVKGNEIELSLNIPIVALKGSNLGIARNINSHWRLIGWGEII